MSFVTAWVLVFAAIGIVFAVIDLIKAFTKFFRGKRRNKTNER